MSSTREAKALERLFTSFGREFEGRLLPMSVTFPGLASGARKEPALKLAPELSPAARLYLWPAAVALLQQTSSFVDKANSANASLAKLDDVLPTASPTAVTSETRVKGA